MYKKMRFSGLNKTWCIDIDGTLLKHNGHLSDEEELLEGVAEFFEKISSGDKVILLTSREEKYKKKTEKFLSDNNIRFDQIIYGLPFGERIMINDRKNSGLQTAYAVNKTRDEKLDIDFVIDENL